MTPADKEVNDYIINPKIDRPVMWLCYGKHMFP